MHFRTVPGTAQAAASKGFGSVFTDVDRDDTTKIEYFDVNGTLLFSGFVPPFRGNQTLSFLGVAFDAGEEVFLVRISSGDVELGGSNRGGRNLVVMDDFIDGEPQLCPDAGTAGGDSVVGIGRFRRVAPDDQIFAERRGRRARQSAGFSRWTGLARRPPIGSAGGGAGGPARPVRNCIHEAP